MIYSSYIRRRDSGKRTGGYTRNARQRDSGKVCFRCHGWRTQGYIQYRVRQVCRVSTMPIIGSGDIASVLPERDDLLFFASGVSNSQETNVEAFRRETNLLLEQRGKQHIVYFGSLAIYYADTPYTQHKRQMESLVNDAFNKHTIMRIGNISWGTNPHTFINYFREHPEAEVRDEYRYIVDQPEFLHWVDLIPPWNCEMNVPGKRMKVQDAIDEYGHVGIR